MRRKTFALGRNLKVRALDCPFVKDDDSVVSLTAQQYHFADRCLCNHCWGRRPEYVMRSIAMWESEDN